MKKIESKTRKWLRTMFKCVSFTAIAFVFQACYGPAPDRDYDLKLTGVVTSKTTNLPVKGIKVVLDNDVISYGMTDENGKFQFYASVPLRYAGNNNQASDQVMIKFLDIDGDLNGSFVDKTMTIKYEKNDEVRLFVELEEKQ